MHDLTAMQRFLDRAEVDAAVLALRQAEAGARRALGERPVEELPHAATGSA